MSSRARKLKYAKQMVEDVVQRITTQSGILENQVISIIKATVTDMVREDVWKGPAADAHANEIRTKVLPQLDSILTSMKAHGNHTKEAATIIENADLVAKNKVDALIARIKSIAK